jgi:hypothetical protein
MAIFCKWHFWFFLSSLALWFMLVVFDTAIDQLCTNQMVRNGFALKESQQQCEK